MKSVNFLSNLASSVMSDSGQDGKKAVWKFIIQTMISILTAILTALGTTSCMGLH